MDCLEIPTTILCLCSLTSTLMAMRSARSGARKPARSSRMMGGTSCVRCWPAPTG